MLSEIYILANLCKGPNHGYGISHFSDAIKINNKTLYSALRKFTEKGYVTKEFCIQEGRAGKNIYTITDSGVQYLKDLLNDFDENKATSWLDFLVRINFHNLMEKEDVLRICDLRLRYLNNAKIENANPESFENLLSDGILDLSQAHISERIENEKRFIEKVKKRIIEG